MGVLQNKLVLNKLSKLVDENVGSSEGNKLKKLLDITQTCNSLFLSKTITDVSDIFSYDDTENVTDMSYMFRYCHKLTTIPQLNTSNVTTMTGMFNGCTVLTPMPQLDTRNVTNMSSMFFSCEKLTTIPQLDTRNVTNMSNMFQDCPLLTKIDITYFNISSTSNSNNFCYYCRSLKSLIIRGFGTSYVLNSNAFNNCYHLTGTVNVTYNPNGDKDGYIYVPSAMVDTLKSATNWSTYADQIRALEDYTVDGTTTGELDESKVNA